MIRRTVALIALVGALNAVTWRDMVERPALWGDTASRCKAPWPSAVLKAKRNVCVAAQLYKISGTRPWGL